MVSYDIKTQEYTINVYTSKLFYCLVLQATFMIMVI